MLAASNFERALDFYKDKFGLEPVSKDGGGALFEAGDAQFFVYPSDFAGTNKATAVSFVVDEIDATVTELINKGVEFEIYEDMPDVRLEGKVHIMGDLKAAWCKDSEGNILNFLQNNQ